MRILSFVLTGVVALTTLQAATAQTRAPASDPTPPTVIQKKAPERARPDLVVIKAVRGPDYSNGQGRIFVQIKNVGSGAAAKERSIVTHNNSAGCGTYFMVPALGPGEVSSHTLRYCEDIAKGTRIRVVADESDMVAESKENNNVHHFNW